MSNLEIKKKIDSNNEIIEKMLTPNQFTLNNIVSELLKENRELQKKCTHEFVDGYCSFCYMAEDNNAN